MSSTRKATCEAPRLFDPSGFVVSLGGLLYSRSSSVVSPTSRLTCRRAAPGTPTAGPSSGERLPFSFLFVFLGALPCSEWLGKAVERDQRLRSHRPGCRQRGPARDQ